MALPKNQVKRINRTFCNISSEGIAEVERTSLLAQMRLSGGAIHWDDLLKSQRILVISEAGTGKTYECRSQQRVLWDNGEPAFYLDLAELAVCGLRDLLSADEETRLDAWLTAQSEVATFFLDSIDELKLTLGSFETALKRLGKVVAGQLRRVRVVITTRPIPVDQEMIRKHLPVPDPVDLDASADVFADIAMGRHQDEIRNSDAKNPSPWRTVTLMPLSDEQIKDMAAIESVDDPEILLADILRRNAEDFARRPQDLVELCADWRDFRRIRTHREQIAHNIEVKLRPRTERRESAPLSPDKALTGASRLALAALLTRRLTIRHSVESDRYGEPGTSLDPATVLHDWTADERRTLIERALFGFASYGRVRFHHRSVIEYLAACRLEETLSRGMPMRSVKRLLFANTPQGVMVVKPTMRPVAAWLAGSQPSIYAEVCDREPELLLNHADPERLTADQRIEALRIYVRRYGQGGWRGMHVPRVQVERFGSAVLGSEIRHLWKAGIENPEVRELMLDLIASGPIHDCADLAYEIAMDSAAERGERADAIRALVGLDDSRLEGVTRSLELEPHHWHQALVRRAINQLFPRHISVDRLCRVLERTQQSQRSTGELEWVLPLDIAAAPLNSDYFRTLCAGLTELVTEDLVWRDRWPHSVSKRPHLVQALSAVCLRLIKAGHTDIQIIRSAVIALRLAREEELSDKPSQTLREAFRDMPDSVRESAFWSCDAFAQALHPQETAWSRLFEVSYHGPLDLNFEHDGAWMKRSLSDHNRPLPERAMVLEALTRSIWDGTGKWQDHVENLRQYVADSPELLEQIDDQLKPKPVNSEQVKLEAKISRQRKSAELRDAKHHAEWVAFWQEISEHPEAAFSPDQVDKTVWNLWQAMQRSGNESRSSGWNRRFLERCFGKDVVDRLRAGMRSVWRKDCPSLRVERGIGEKGVFLIRWQLGLAAIAAEAEDAGWARQLSFEEAELATRYAAIELNGFPAWLEQVAAVHPSAVERTLGPDLEEELNEMAAPNSFAILLQAVSHAPSIVISLFVPRLASWLDANASRLREHEDVVATNARLQRVLEILLTHGGDSKRSHLLSLAHEQVQAAGDERLDRSWLSILMRLDPNIGTDIFERKLASWEPAQNGPAVTWFANLFGERRGNFVVDLTQPEFTPALLLRLVRLAFRYIRPSDDVEHEGTYTPGPRDDAQDARHALLKTIVDSKGPDAWAIKLEMADDPLFVNFRDRLALLAKEKAAEEMDEAVLSEADVAAIDRYGEAPPATREEMFALLLDRLDDLDDLLLQDVSPRASWEMIRDEKVMRQVIALQLRHAANQAYTVDQEAVTADEKETDIRLRATTLGQQATIELKIGENGWSGRVLRDTLRNQLVTKYMAADSCRAGCLVVTVATNRKWEHPETGDTLDVKGLEAMLNAEAARIVSNMGGQIRLAAKVLDLRPRLTTERG
ncbi:ATP-binding protein [Cupriavidus sp. L7L]|uniref:ATP-binding protein n=1 Tax=Cupriavidus sp. L7L TaxID=2546443 RepID=UPI00105575A9|nr:ATP-binding protein [Cupriavidus sp. L7L]TDF58114.1 ATP-binding protein [Cupriavidus sp. L7L]